MYIYLGAIESQLTSKISRTKIAVADRLPRGKKIRKIRLRRESENEELQIGDETDDPVSGQNFLKQQCNKANHCHATVECLGILRPARLRAVSDVHFWLDREVIFFAVVVNEDFSLHNGFGVAAL